MHFKLVYMALFKSHIYLVTVPNCGLCGLVSHSSVVSHVRGFNHWHGWGHGSKRETSNVHIEVIRGITFFQHVLREVSIEVRQICARTTNC